MEGTLQMQGNTCFVCAGTEGWTKIDEKTDIAEFTICETHQTGRLQRDMTTALVDKAEFERHNPQPGSRDPQLSELYRQEIIKNTYRDDANYQREARERVEDALAESGDERESFNVPSPDNIDPEFGLLVEETALREDAGTLSAGTRKKFHEWLNSNIAFFSSSIFYRYDPSERKVSFFSAGARDCPEENIRVVPNEIIRADGTYVRTDDTKVCLLDIELRNPSGVIDDSLLSRTAFTLDEITEMISEIRRKEGSFGIIPETDSIPENQFLEVGLRELRQFKVLLDRGVLSDATVVSTEGERLDVSKLPAMRSYFQAADYVRNSDMTTTEKMNVIYPIIHSMANNEYDSERFEDENPETFTYMWSEMILPQETVAGICRDKAVLYATLLRYAGIDAQIQAGYIPFAVKNPVDLTIGDLKLAKLNPGAHAWIKINTPECSFEIDPTWYNDTSSYVPVHRVTDECEE
ncbi:MAG: hypothetical protein HYT73_05210 [Candidatus Aenigmarchaeota archaeon]|nr:hypothetical protein [Candidatus Aenigmarchaeota archaeon]